MKPEVKKLILSNLPYLIFVYLFGKLGQAYRLAAGVDLSEKLLHFMDGCSAAFANAAPSIHPFDLLIGVAGAAALRLMVYFKGKNAKKYRKGEEYGSARWGTAKDIAPYIDPNFDNSSQFVSRGMCVDFAIHDTDSGNPHCHIMLTTRPLDERGAWAAKSKKEYDLDENGERIRLPSGRYKTHKVDLTGWNDKGNALLWRKAWADISNAYLERAGSRSRIDHRSNAERGIDELPTVHMGVAACQMEKKGIATEKGELNRNIQKANRLIREIRAQIGKLKEWIGELFKARETAPEQPPQSPGLANLLIKLRL